MDNRVIVTSVTEMVDAGASVLVGADNRLEEPRNEFSTVELELQVPSSVDRKVFDSENVADLFCGDVLVTCQWCNQWGARKTACSYCGGPIE